MFAEETIRQIKSKHPIEGIISLESKLTSTGKDSYICKCPLHKGNADTMIVDASTGTFHCFECGASGDIFDYSCNKFDISFHEALKWLTQRSGLKPLEMSESDNYRLYQMNFEALKFFHGNLSKPEGKKALDYLMNTRKLTKETILKYRLGSAPDRWDSLKQHMLGLGYSEEELLDASLISRSSKTGKTYDFYIDRAIFPFVDLNGRIIGFGGRTLNQNDRRKYLNSKDTAVYSKKNFLFSLNFAKKYLEQDIPLLLVEGNLDVVTLNQFGFPYAAASCGTALTSFQAEIIKEHTDRVIICYDNDEAGEKATVKAINLLESAGLKVYVMRLFGANDPDEYIRKFGSISFKNEISKSYTALEYKVLLCMRGLDMAEEKDKEKFFKKLYKEILPKYDDKEVLKILEKYRI